MFHKQIKIPKAFQELHGEQTRLSTLILIYLAGLGLATFMILQLLKIDLPVWKLLLVGILFLDIGGGVVANLSTPTNQYYQTKPRLRTTFILMHLLHPALFTLVFTASWPYFVFVGGFTIASMIFINAFKDAEFQQNLAAVLVTAGIAVSLIFTVPLLVLYSFGPLFMIKLILGFSVKRPPFVIS